jgi:hypothetical protein
VSGIDGKIASKTDGSSAEFQDCFAENSAMHVSTAPGDTTLPYRKDILSATLPGALA